MKLNSLPKLRFEIRIRLKSRKEHLGNHRRQFFLILCIFFLCFSNLETCESLRVFVLLLRFFSGFRRRHAPKYNNTRHCRRESETTEKPISERPQPLPQPHVVGVVPLPQSLPSYWTNQELIVVRNDCRGIDLNMYIYVIYIYTHYRRISSYYVHCIWYIYIYIYTYFHTNIHLLGG